MKKENFNVRYFVWGMGVLITIMLLATLNPFGHNDLGYREVVETPTGNKYVIFNNGVYFKFPGSKVSTYPNVITISHRGEKTGSTIEGNLIPIRFNDATEAVAQTVVRFRLPNDSEQMLLVHSEYVNVEYLALKGLQPYTIECLKNSAQLMDSEQHYSGGRAQLSQFFQDQLAEGLFILDTRESFYRDTITGETKRIYESKIRTNKQGESIRKQSDLKKFGITIASATIENVDYESQVDEKLKKKIEASTRESVSKQNLVTAQQEAMTAEAEGRKRLVEIEYEEMQRQTQSVVQAETQVKLALKDKEKQEIALDAARLEAQKIKALADAEAYAKQRIMQADGALEKKLDAYKEVQQMWATAFQNFNGDLVPKFQTGGSGGKGNAGIEFMDILTAKAAMDLNLNTKVKAK
jgi:regulator of protease activity HflC (stomatin/prohibitin superfamily)